MVGIYAKTNNFYFFNESEPSLVSSCEDFIDEFIKVYQKSGQNPQVQDSVPTQ